MTYNTAVSTHSLYIHWPFCPYKCHFCPFVALAGHDQFMSRYHEALNAEMRNFARTCNRRLKLDTVYMGGGTPSTYPDDLLLDTFGTLGNAFEITPSTEITLEVNPGTVRDEQLPLWKSAGINRLSIGVQSLKDSALKNLNRHQTAKDVFKLLERGSSFFDNMSVDLIIGLPGVTQAEWKEFLSTMVTLPITHMSIYFLTVHEDTALYFRVQKNQIALEPDDAMVDTYLWSVAFLEEQGFLQYEVSSFARQGYQSRHNATYWQRKPYKGFGLGACSFDGQARSQNEKNLMKYLEMIQAGSPITIFHETLTPYQVYIEKIMLGIRQKIGVNLVDALQGLTQQEEQKVRERIQQLQQGGFVIERDNHVILTPQGLSVENQIASQLAQS